MQYEKYFDLEKYVFGEVADSFHKKGYLTSEEFFLIIIWKSNRAKSKIARKFDNETSLDVAIKKLTTSIYNSSTFKGKLAILINDYGFYLPMASAILSVLYQDEFSIYDIRVCDVLKEKYSTDKYHKLKNWTFERLWAAYEDYLRKIIEVSGKHNYRDADKYLWSQSFYEQLQNDLENRFVKMKKK